MKKIISFAIKALLILLTTLITAFAGIIIYMSITMYKPEKIEPLKVKGSAIPISDDQQTFSILTWNLGYFGLGKEMDFFYDGGKSVRPSKSQYEQYSKGALEYLTSTETADFYLFQEVDLHSCRSYFNDEIMALGNTLKDHAFIFAKNYDVKFVPVPFTNPMGRVKSGISCFYRYKSTENTRHAFLTGYSWPKQLFMLSRCFILSKFPLPSGKELIIINTHNEAFDSGSQRKEQMVILRNTMMQEFKKGNYVIAGGDWNLNPLGFDPSAISSGDPGHVIQPQVENDFLPVEWRWVFDPAIPSNRDVDQSYVKGRTPTTIIDFFVVSPNIRVIGVKTDDIGFAWSDHQPVRMKFTLD